ncbi:DUF4911 domain-containing protein [Amycolatopsis sp. GM8]|uniref:DUF4911 domain-containing protein n=1 Tax=Amycolatopsis sp. GM8 TaxID=2896530 RepID=UPI001F36534F|nr:DUF4911 domain-containing protein [Amycolatopsis sp. GM8]
MASDSIGGLNADLDSLLVLLDDADEQHWSRWFRAARRDLSNRDAYGLRRILQAYGGMGSFNDLVIHPRNGHTISPDEARQVNERLDTLRTQIYRVAHQLRREQPR